MAVASASPPLPPPPSQLESSAESKRRCRYRCTSALSQSDLKSSTSTNTSTAYRPAVVLPVNIVASGWSIKAYFLDATNMFVGKRMYGVMALYRRCLHTSKVHSIISLDGVYHSTVGSEDETRPWYGSLTVLFSIGYITFSTNAAVNCVGCSGMQLETLQYLNPCTTALDFS